ncbi:MAG: Trk system potassium transporter TrkA, partial [Gemmatimonadales bacterium]
INPERELALETIGLLQVTAAREVAVFAGGAVQLMGITVADDAPIAGRKLQEIGAEERHRSILTVGIERDGRTIVPGGATEVRAGDHLYVVTGAPDVRRAIELCGYERSTVRRVMVAGGSLEAFYVGELLAQHGVQMTMLVDDRERAQELAGRLDHALVLHGDATDVELLEMEGVGGADAFVALTDEDDTNILSSLVAKHAGAKQIITLVNKPAYVPLARRIGLDAAVSPRLSAANAILRYVRAGSVKRVATFSGHEGEAIAFAVGAQSPAVGRPLAEVNFPEGSIVAAVVRGRDVVVPRGDDVLQVGDTAIVFALPDAIREVTEIFPS